MTDLPAPFVPPEVDLTDYPDMLFAVDKFLDSGLMRIQDAKVFRCNVVSWPKSWHQNPAASLPDSDEELAGLLGYGFDVRGFRKLREAGGLRGWIKCSDGRLYHKVTAGKALEAWISKLTQRLGSGAGTAKKLGISFDRTDVETQLRRAMSALRVVDPKSKVLQRRRIVGGARERPEVEPRETPEERPPDTPPDTPDALQVKGREGKGIEVKKKENPESLGAATVAEAQAAPALTGWDLVEIGLSEASMPPGSAANESRTAMDWGRRGFAESDVRGGIAMARKKNPDFRPNRLSYYTQAIEDFRNAARPVIPSAKTPDASTFTEEKWRGCLLLRKADPKFIWPAHWGTEPGTATCLVPAHLQREFGFQPRTVEAAQ